MRWAGGRSSCSVVTSVSGGVGGARESGHESGEVGILGDGGVAVDGDETVVVALLGILVDEATGVDARHFGVVECGNFFECAGVSVAAVFREAMI